MIMVVFLLFLKFIFFIVVLLCIIKVEVKMFFWRIVYEDGIIMLGGLFDLYYIEGVINNSCSNFFVLNLGFL